MPRRHFLPDLLATDLALVIVGFNPGAVSAARGHYYAKPGNQFYPLLHRAGLTPALLSPDQDYTLPRHGIGLVDLCPWRAGQSDILTPRDVSLGRKALLWKLAMAGPRAVAFNGLTVFKHVFGRMPAPGLQEERLGESAVFALPSTSGLVNGRWRERELAFLSLAAWLRSRGPAAGG